MKSQWVRSLEYTWVEYSIIVAYWREKEMNFCPGLATQGGGGAGEDHLSVHGSWKSWSAKSYSQLHLHMYSTIFTSQITKVENREILEMGGLCWLLKLGKWGIKEYIWKGFFLGWFVGLVAPVQRDFCPVLAALVGPAQNIFLLTIPYLTSFLPIAQQAGQAVVPGRLSLNMCLWLRHCAVMSSLQFPPLGSPIYFTAWSMGLKGLYTIRPVGISWGLEGPIYTRVIKNILK
jgi:hypothetical protein